MKRIFFIFSLLLCLVMMCTLVPVALPSFCSCHRIRSGDG